MDGVLSQEEISALLNNPDDANKNDLLTDAEKDAIGEIGNISMGTAATTLFSLVNRKVDISTPVVSFATWSDICDAYEKPCVFIRIAYTVGLDGSNILVLKEHDVKVFTDLMMGGDGTNTDGELGELHLSAISEAMNQMMGSAATSLSSMLNKTIDISPPVADLVDLHDNIDEGSIADFLSGSFVKISFKMEIGDLVDSEIMQLYPVSFAKEMCASITKNMEADTNSTSNEAEFQAFNPSIAQVAGAENIGLIMDVPLEVTVELGRTTKSIHEILDFAPGTIIELNRIAGEPIDILVNGKYVAKGEVVVIEESFGVRITEIVK